MTDRILDLSEAPVRLSVWQGLLRIEQDTAAPITMPFEDVAAVVGAHRQVTFTQAVFAKLAEHGAVFVACDATSKPVAMMLPLEGHHLQSERFAVQAAATQPMKKRIWQTLVRAKIRAQAKTLVQLHGADSGLARMANNVRSGDPDNLEGQAARRYWPKVFADEPTFIRDRELPGRNALLNFGYTILRAVTARAICAAGLHPSLGVHHHNRYDAFVLADDLMEPFRPMVDVAVARHTVATGENCPLDKDAKKSLYQAVYAPVILQKEQRSLFDALTRVCASMIKVFQGERKTIVLPE